MSERRRHSLPSRESFLENNIETMERCYICLEPFNEHHPPARFAGSNSCQHIFGLQCLRSWLTSSASGANTCPCCREVLFRKCRTNIPRREERSLQITIGGRATIQFNLNDSRESLFSNRYRDLAFRDIAQPQITQLIHDLWHALWDTYQLGSPVYRDDVEDSVITVAVRQLGPRSLPGTTVHPLLRGSARLSWWGINHDQWSRLQSIARDMVRLHFRNRYFAELRPVEIEYWVTRVCDVMNWVPVFDPVSSGPADVG